MSNNKNLRSQIFIYCFVALIVEMNQWNLVMWLITDTLPYSQVQTPHIQVHISYLLQKCKKGKPRKRICPIEKRYHKIFY
jgi:hypothetical protein